MAWTYNIENAFGTVTLNSGGAQVIDYAARSARVMDGNETVDEPFRILITGTSRANVDAIVGTIQRKFREGERWQQSKNGARTFFTRSLADDTTTKRSEFVSADFSVSSPEYIGTSVYGGHFGAYRTELSGVITRRNWWEGALGTATITSLNADCKTYNNGDFTGTAPTKKVNYFDIDATGFQGDLPSPIRMTISPASFEGTANTAEWVSINCVYSQSRGVYTKVEDNWSEAFMASFGGTANVDTNLTNDAYYNYVTTTTDENLLFDKVAGPYFLQFGNDVGNYRVYIHMAVGTAGTHKVTPFLTDLISYSYGAAQYLSLTTSMQIFDLGIIRWPSGHSTALATGNLYFGIRFGTSGVNVLVDWGHIIRVSWYRKYSSSRGIYAALIDDQIDGDMAGFLTGGDLAMGINRIGHGPMVLVPGKWHRFYMHTNSQGAGAVVAKNVYVVPTILYRPRYLSL